MTGDPIASSQVVEGGACHHGPALDVVALLQAREDEAHHDAPEHQHHHQDQTPEGMKKKDKELEVGQNPV